MSEVIAAEDVRRSYGGTVALDGVSLSVPAGESFGLIGPNGAGKTTLVRALTGTARVDEGRVRLLGAPPAAVERGRIGLLPQSFTPHERLTAAELLRYYAGLYDDPRDPEAVLSDVGLEAVADTRYGDLSGGERRRACVGAALVNDPEVLFLDEPTTGIDPAGRRAVWRLLEGLADRGTTLLLTSHSMPEVERLADRVGLLGGGQLLATGAPADLVAEHGGPNRLTVRTSGAPEPATVERVEGALEAAVAAARDGLTVEGIDPREVGAAVEAVEAAGLDCESLTWAEPGLEEVYLRLTGERFEGAAPAAGVRAGAGEGAGDGEGISEGVDGPSGAAGGGTGSAEPGAATDAGDDGDRAGGRG